MVTVHWAGLPGVAGAGGSGHELVLEVRCRRVAQEAGDGASDLARAIDGGTTEEGVHNVEVPRAAQQCRRRPAAPQKDPDIPQASARNPGRQGGSKLQVQRRLKQRDDKLAAIGRGARSCAEFARSSHGVELTRSSPGAGPEFARS